MVFKGRRRRFIVNKRIQYKFFIIVISYLLFIVFLLGFLMFIPSILGLSGEAAFEKQVVAAQEFLTLHKRFWPSILAIILILGIHSIYIFHRVFGPMYRFKDAFERISKGDLSFNIQLRRSDYLVVEKDSINNMINSLREIIGSLKRDHMTFFEEIKQLDEKLTSSDITLEVVRNKLKEVRENGE